MIPTLQKIRAAGSVDAELLNRIQDNVGKAHNPLALVPLLNGVLLTSQVLAVGSNTLNHGLGRPPLGWLPVRVRAATTLSDTQDSNANPSLTLLITSSAAATVDLWVF